MGAAITMALSQWKYPAAAHSIKGKANYASEHCLTHLILSRTLPPSGGLHVHGTTYHLWPMMVA